MMSAEITPEEIKRIRMQYGLTQQAFARVLGIGDASIVRYENGQKPTKAIANLIRAADNKEFMLDCLKRDGECIAEEQRNKAERIIYSEVSFNEKGEIMDINEIYELTLQQEILSEHAAHILSDLHRMYRQAELDGDEMRASIIDDAITQVAVAKHNIVSKEYDSMAKLSELRGKINGMMEFAKAIYAKAA